ncbi:MAG TPA: trypsin-like peptidase domain-containing protein [Bacteroidia bacterium]|nr:trypsin-like peptidase domain-containing protein [Bacteroidia bacterium]
MKYIFSFFLVLFSDISFSQSKQFFNKNGQSCNEANAYYYRVKENGNFYKSYYVANNNLYFQGEIINASNSDEKLNKYKGNCKWYYKNGNLMYEKNFDENGNLNGWSYEYYENGKLKKKAEYVNGKLKNNIYFEYTLEGEEYKVFEENFSNNVNQWDLYDSDKSSAKIINDSLVLESFTNKGTSRYISEFNGTENFIIETSIDYSLSNSNERAGLIFGFKDWNNYYYFLLSGNKVYIGYVKEGLLVQKAEGMFCSSCKEKNVNTLKVLMSGDKLIFSVNGDVQNINSAISFSGLNIGFATSGKNKIFVKNLIIKYSNPTLSSNATSESDKNVSAIGSGVLVSKDGYVVTNEHVIKNAKKIFIEINSKNYQAELVKSDKDNDLAILKIKDSSFYKNENTNVPFIIKDNFNLDLGSYVYTVGFPLALSGMGKEPKFSDGKVSAKTGYEGALNSFQTTIPVQPGNSGSPVFNEKGELVGIINAKIQGGDNVSYALKSTFVKNLLDVLSEKVNFNNTNQLQNLKLEEQIKLLTNFIYLIKIQ